jgi:hypothetical protein
MHRGKGHVRTQQESGSLQAKKRLRKEINVPHLDPGLPASITVRKYISIV